MSETPNPSNSPSNSPLLSALLVTLDHIDGLGAVMRYLATQTIHQQIELVFAVPSCATSGIDAAVFDQFPFNQFAAVHIVEAPSATTREALYTAAVFGATAPFVVFMEDHCFPEPDWAEYLMQVHRDFAPCAVVGPSLVNANPESVTSWAHLIVGFGDWIAPVETGQANRLPAHNSCYRREVLSRYSHDELLSLLHFELQLHDQLRKQGERLYIAGNSRVHHINMSTFTLMLLGQIDTLRNYGANRRRHWSILRRLVYIFGSPLIPLILFARMFSNAKRAAPPHLRLAIYGLLFVTTCAMGIGELLGYIIGAGKCQSRITAYETQRIRYVTAQDKQLIKMRYGF